MGTFKFIQKRSLIDEAEIHGYEANGIGKSTPVTVLSIETPMKPFWLHLDVATPETVPELFSILNY